MQLDVAELLVAAAEAELEVLLLFPLLLLLLFPLLQATTVAASAATPAVTARERR
jgi:hypothetical protein